MKIQLIAGTDGGYPRASHSNAGSRRRLFGGGRQRRSLGAHCALCLTLVFSACPFLRADDGSLKAAFIARLAAIQNLNLHYTIDVQSTPPPEYLNKTVEVDGQKYTFNNSREGYVTDFRFLRGLAMYTIRPNDETARAAAAKNEDCVTTKRIFEPARVDTLCFHSLQRWPSGAIDGHVEFNEVLYIDTALGLRLYHGAEWLSTEALQRSLTVERRDGETAVLLLRDAQNFRHRWTVRLSDPSELLWYRVSDPDDVEILAFEMDQRAQLGSVRLPKKIIVTRIDVMKGQPRRVTETDTLIITDCVVGDKNNRPDAYHMVWPKGSGVIDTRTGEDFHIVSGNRTLTDREIYEVLKKNEDAATRPSAEH